MDNGYALNFINLFICKVQTKKRSIKAEDKDKFTKSTGMVAIPYIKGILEDLRWIENYYIVKTVAAPYIVCLQKQSWVKSFSLQITAFVA
jgi:hypothetical protein